MLGRYNARATDAHGNLITDPVVLAQRMAAGMPSAGPIYADVDGTASLGNPTSQGSFPNGKIGFHLPAGWYRITVTSPSHPGWSDVLDWVAIGSAQALDVPPLTLRGPWSSDALYSINDLCESSGVTYGAIALSEGVEPGVAVGWEEYWVLVSARGATGDKGDKGDQGDKGDKGDAGDGIAGGVLALSVRSDPPELPSIGAMQLFASADKRIYTQDSDGLVQQIGGTPLPPGWDDLLIATGVTAMHMSDLIAYAHCPSPLMFADSFASLAYVDVAGATNLSTSTASVLRPTASSGTTATIANANGTVGLQNLTVFARAAAVLNSVSVSAIGAFSTVARAMELKIGLRNSAGNYTVVVNLSVSHPGGGWGDFGLPVPFNVPASGNYYLGAFTSVANPDVNTATPRAWLSGNQTGTAGGYTEDTVQGFALRYVHSASTSNLTVATAGLPIVGEPASMRGLLLMEHGSGVTANTDFMLDFSRNNGGTWTAAPLSFVRNVPLSGGDLKLYRTDDIDLTSVAFNTAARVRMRTANNKMLGFAALCATATVD
ncbi:hypothetical protein APY04_0841 [Hyphomicrobium sulfonivorans]|uniref:Phage tail fiber protein n=1 Tax=Hyphomicrobium sulfonivorans TaxID=121290 RepID=A0A120CXD5_HYPSL|nr:hypothetical protein [Hyphomicrobium sulfonivorans]KWT70780.1 hypothetical protein APY04_0841 [Hyphomicrobium sulfonivorans]